MNPSLGSFICNLSSVLGSAVGGPGAIGAAGDGSNHLVTDTGDHLVTDTGDRIIFG